MTMSTFRRVVAGTILGLTLPFWAHGAAAQNDAPSSRSPEQLSLGLTDQKLDDAAAALDHVSNLQQRYQDKAATAPPADRDRILEEGNQAVTKAVTEHGLSVKEYAAFLSAAKNDPEVHEKVFQRIRRWRIHKGPTPPD